MIFKLMTARMKTGFIILITLSIFCLFYSFYYSIDLEGSTDDGNIHLRLVHWDNGGSTETDLVKVVCEEFEKDHPGITVDVEIISSYEQQFNNLMASKDIPDVFCVPDGNFGQWVKTGVMLNLTDYFENSEVITDYDKAHLAESALQRYRYDGSTMGKGDLYCMPKDITPYVMYYNKDLFDEYGVEYPSKTEIMTPYEALEMWKQFGYNLGTVSTYKTGSKKGQLKLSDDHVYGVAKLYPEGLIWSNGGDYLSSDRTEVLINTPEFIEVYDYIVECQMEYAVAPTSDLFSSTSEKTLFLNGKAACYIEGRSVTTDLREKADFEWDIAPIPAFETNQQCNGWSGSVGYGVYVNTPYPDEAYQLAEYFTSKRGQLIMAEAGFTAPLYNDEETLNAFLELEEGKLPANTQEFIRAAQYQKPGLWQYLPSVRWKERLDSDTGAMFTADPSTRLTPEQFFADEESVILNIIKQDFPELFEKKGE